MDLVVMIRRFGDSSPDIYRDVRRGLDDLVYLGVGREEIDRAIDHIGIEIMLNESGLL